ncbi:DUF982 domain-containing protein [Rhizobium binxianense]
MANRDDRGFEPLKISNEDGGEELVISTVEGAIRYVTDLWPVRNGEAYEEALQACIDGMNDRISPTEVREILLRAARKAGVCIIR